MGKKSVRKEEFEISGDKLVAKLKELVHQGNIRHITIKNAKGETLIDIPLAVGVVGAAILPVWAAVGALAALIANFKIAIERIEE